MKQFDENLEMFSLNTKSFLDRFKKADIASSQMMVGRLRMKMESRKADSYAYMFAATDRSVLRKAETKQFRQVVRASAAVKTYAASGGCVSEWFFALFGRNKVSPTFLNGSTFLQSTLNKKKGAREIILSQYVLTTAEARFFLVLLHA